MPLPGDILAQALQQHQSGNLVQAQQLYVQILQADPYHVDALHLLGVLASQVGRHDLAVDYIRQAITLRPQVAMFHNNLGFSLQALGKLQDAAASYRQAVTIQPSYVEAHNNLGNALRELGQANDAARSYEQALALRPDYAEAHNNLGVALQELGRIDEAMARYREALRLQPNFQMAQDNLNQALRQPRQAPPAWGGVNAFQPPPPPPVTGASAAQSSAHNERGIALANKGRYDEAGVEFQRALQFRPDDASVHSNLGNILYYQGNYDAAIASYRQAIRYRKDYAEAHSNLGNVLLANGNPVEAVAHCREAVRINPNLNGAYTNLGNALREKGQLEEAEAAYVEVLRQAPENAEGHGNLASLYKDRGMIPEAKKHLEMAVKLQPNSRLRILLATLLPPLYSSMEDLHAWRDGWANNVKKLLDDKVTLDLTYERAQPQFYLVYHGFNDRDLQREIVRLYTTPPDPKLPAAARPSGSQGKIRIGFASKHFRLHTVSRLFQGLMARLSRELFHVTVFSVGSFEDPVARQIRESADAYFELRPSMPYNRRLIADQQLDVLFYPDIGMDPVTYTLAFSRLAPVQCVSWGHGVTTGIPALDYFISSEQLESDESDQHYTEQLVRLKVPAVHYQRPEPPRPLKGPGDFGLPSAGTLYAVPQTLFKFHPEFDTILAEVLRRDPRGTLVLIEGKFPRWMQILRERFERTMPDVLRRIRYLGKLDHADYLNLNAIADVLLDPIHFGGGNTSYEGLAMGTPIVTLPTKILRGRITWMLYHQMGVMDCVVNSPEEYVDKAVRLGKDRDYRAEVRAKIAAASPILFENSAGIRELEQFLQAAVRRARAGLPPVAWPAH